MTEVWEQEETVRYSRLLGESYRRLTGEELLPGHTPDEADYARALYEAPFPLVSHGTQEKPIFRYANDVALKLWETDWETFTQLPSSKSAPDIPEVQRERSGLLSEALRKGAVKDYSGVRVSCKGKLFRIGNTVLWNVTDADGRRHGQAARIGRTQELTPEEVRNTDPYKSAAR